MEAKKLACLTSSGGIPRTCQAIQEERDLVAQPLPWPFSQKITNKKKMLILRLVVILLVACVVFGGLFFGLGDNNLLELVSQILALLTEVAGTSVSLRGLLKK